MQLHLVQDLARSRSEAAVEGEVYKWLGHCWSKLADARKAEAYFLEGAGWCLEGGAYREGGQPEGGSFSAQIQRQGAPELQ